MKSDAENHGLPADPVQTQREIRALLDAGGLRPRKRFGQHFLIDGNLMRRLVRAAEPGLDDVVLEVGGGTGGLTDLLIGRVAHVVCVEVDTHLHALLADRFRDPIRNHQLTLLHGDVLEGKHRISAEVLKAVKTSWDRRPSCKTSGGQVKLVANLPYSVVTPLVMNLLVDEPMVRRLVFTVQAEVGERLTAQPGSKAYGPLSIMAQGLCRIRVVARVSARSFWPRPAIDSLMLRMDVLPGGPTSSTVSLEQRESLPSPSSPPLPSPSSPPLPTRSSSALPPLSLSPLLSGLQSDREALRRFSAFVRATFDHRRKTLRVALGYVLDQRQRDRICQRIDGTRRPEVLNLQEWLAIFETLEDES